MRIVSLPIIAIMSAVIICTTAADDGKTGRKAVTKTKAVQSSRSNPVEFTAAEERTALDFVRKHQSELAELLEHLKKSGSKQYERAIRDVLRSAERLSQLKKRDASRHGLELKAWKIKTQVQLLAARLSMTKDSKLEGKLKAAVAEHFDLQLEMTKQNRSQLKQRLEKLDKNIDRLKRSRDQSIQRQYNTLVGVGEKSPKKPPVKKKTVSASTDGDGNSN